MENGKLKFENGNKTYTNPEVEKIEVLADDVITTSPGTEMPKYDEDDGIWEYSISNG